MALAIGPCMFVAPLVPIIALLLLPLWLLALVVTTVVWLLVWPVDRLLAAIGVPGAGRAAAALTRWLVKVATPWRIFDLPRKAPPPPPPPGGDTA